MGHNIRGDSKGLPQEEQMKRIVILMLTGILVAAFVVPSFAWDNMKSLRVAWEKSWEVAKADTAPIATHKVSKAQLRALARARARARAEKRWHRRHLQIGLARARSQRQNDPGIGSFARAAYRTWLGGIGIKP